MEFTFRPIDQWPRPFTKERRGSQFKAGYSDTLTLLGGEIEKLGTARGVIEMALGETAIRNDGLPRAHAQPSHPGVIVSFESRKTGPVRMPCDAFTHWHDNLRAIALSLEALRKVDRYGVTSHAEQYRGWAKLPPPGQAVVTPPPMSVDEASAFMAAHVSGAHPMSAARNPDMFKTYYRHAAKAFHPDLNGGRHMQGWDTLQRAKAVLERHHGIL